MAEISNKIALFEKKEIRKIWHEEQWFFSVVDVVGALTNSVNPTDYLKKLRKRDNELKIYIGTDCPQVKRQNNEIGRSWKRVNKFIRKTFHRNS